MRILQVVHALPPDTYGGTELHTKHLAERLAADHEVQVARPGGADAAVSGCEVVDLPGGVNADADPDSVGAGPAAGVVREAVDERFAAVLDEFAPDIVHFQHLKGLSATLPVICRERSVACVATLHDFWTICHREQLYQPDGSRCSGPDSIAKCADCYSEWRRRATTDGGSPSSTGADGADRWLRDVEQRARLLRRALSAVDRLVAPSKFLRRRFVEFGVDPEHIVQRRNGIQTERFRDTGFDSSGPVRFGYAGRITETKGVHLLVDAFRRVEADAELHAHGRFDPEDDPYHARLADAASVDDRIQFHGWYADAATPYEGMDVFVLPSLWYENSPLVIQEAFASGLPVVTADVGGMAELVSEDMNGLTFAAGDPAALSRQLCSLADSLSRIDALRDGVTEPKHLRTHAAELETLYTAVSGGD